MGLFKIFQLTETDQEGKFRFMRQRIIRAKKYLTKICKQPRRHRTHRSLTKPKDFMNKKPLKPEIKPVSSKQAISKSVHKPSKSEVHQPVISNGEIKRRKDLRPKKFRSPKRSKSTKAKVKRRSRKSRRKNNKSSSTVLQVSRQKKQHIVLENKIPIQALQNLQTREPASKKGDSAVPQKNFETNESCAKNQMIIQTRSMRAKQAKTVTNPTPEPKTQQVSIKTSGKTRTQKSVGTSPQAKALQAETQKHIPKISHKICKICNKPYPSNLGWYDHYLQGCLQQQDKSSK